jgi:hypothetical protein
MLWFPSEPGDLPFLVVEAETWTAVDALVPAERRAAAVHLEEPPIALWNALWRAPEHGGPTRALLHYRGLLRVLDERAAEPLSQWLTRAVEDARYKRSGNSA